MKDFVSSSIDLQSMYFMSTILLNDKINGVRVPQFQLSCICNKTHPSHENLVDLFREVYYIWWVNKDLELQW